MGCTSAQYSAVHCSEVQCSVSTSLHKLLSLFGFASKENQLHSVQFSQFLTWSVIRCLCDYCSLLVFLKPSVTVTRSVFRLSADLFFLAFSNLAITETPPRVRLKTLRLVSSFKDFVVSTGCCRVTGAERGSVRGMLDTHGAAGSFT